MPRYRSRASRPSEKRKRTTKKDGYLALYLVLSLLCGFTVWWIIKPLPPTGDSDPVPTPADERTPSSHSGQRKLDARQAQDGIPDDSGEEGLDAAIRSAALNLGIPERSIHRNGKNNEFRYRLPLDPNTVDLTFANMIFKGEVENHHGSLISGEERSRRQFLKFTDRTKQKTYHVELYFDGSIYQTRVADKVIAIVVDDFGNIGGDLLRRFHQIDIEVCFAIFPEEPNSVQTMQTATGMGRECLIHVPMEPLGYPRVNPGDNAIFVHLKEHGIQRLMRRFINLMHLCKGINNHMGSFATTDERTMQAVMSVLREHNMYFLDSRTSNVSVAYSTAQRMKVDAYRNDIFLDSPDLSTKTMDEKIQRCIQMASSRQYIVAITHCHTEKHLIYLQEFIRRIRQEGFVIVPVSKLGTFRLPPIS